MDRKQLLDVVNRFFEWTRTKPVDAAAVASILSKDVIVRIPYPGCSPNFDGIVALTAKGHEASPDFEIKIRDTVVDVQASTVVALVQVIGTHSKYSVPS